MKNNFEKITCNMIKDLLPLYAEDMASEDTRKAVEYHLENCVECQKELELIQKPLVMPTETEAELAKKMKRKKLKSRIYIIVASIWSLLLVGGMFVSMAVDLSVEYGPEDIIVEETEDGRTRLVLTECEASSLSCIYTQNERGEATMYVSIDPIPRFFQSFYRVELFLTGKDFLSKDIYADDQLMDTGRKELQWVYNGERYGTEEGKYYENIWDGTLVPPANAVGNGLTEMTAGTRTMIFGLCESILLDEEIVTVYYQPGIYDEQVAFRRYESTLFNEIYDEMLEAEDWDGVVEALKKYNSQYPVPESEERVLIWSRDLD